MLCKTPYTSVGEVLSAKIPAELMWGAGFQGFILCPEANAVTVVLQGNDSVQLYGQNKDNIAK
jgi:hypothetical protein